MKKYSDNELLDAKIAEFDRTSDRLVSYIIHDLDWNVDDAIIEGLKKSAEGMAKFAELLESKKQMIDIEKRIG
jgi:hypothetical protein